MAATMTGHVGPLAAQLEAALLRAIVVEWKHLNWDFFRERLSLPSFALVDTRATLGRWVQDVRTLEVSRTLAVEQPWGVVVEVLKHEMAHQYVFEVLDVRDEGAHGASFRALCRELGIDGAASGLPAPSREHPDDRMLDRIAKLLALAESPNVHEAEAAMAAAQRLMLKHNLDARAQRHAQGYAFRHVGEPTTRVQESERVLASLLGRHFFVEAIWIPVYMPREGKRGSVLELVGTPSNLEIASYVHAYLRDTAERLWRDHKKASGIRGNRDRRTYLAGVMSGFSAKLSRQQEKHREEGLVWVKDADLDGYLRKRHPHMRSFSFGGGRRREAFAHGRKAGEQIVLHRGVSGAPVTRGRLLGR